MLQSLTFFIDIMLGVKLFCECVVPIKASALHFKTSTISWVNWPFSPVLPMADLLDDTNMLYISIKCTCILGNYKLFLFSFLFKLWNGCKWWLHYFPNEESNCLNTSRPNSSTYSCVRLPVKPQPAGCTDVSADKSNNFHYRPIV